ncbi:MAG TPA: hypothetical protein VKB50_17735 [Vicinamibacterales bacterium]|nr:hypothetical protein [Vicinamibacterales bacterium]
MRGTVLLTENTFNSIRFLAADTPQNPSRKLEFGISVLPLARTILDSVFTVAFLFEDLPTRWSWFLKSGWREQRNELERYRTEYGTDSDWTDWLQQNQELLDWLKTEAPITPAEEADATKLIRWWPNPGKMANQVTDTRLQADLRYLNDWFYREMSAASHLSWTGFAKQAGHLLKVPDAERDDTLKKYRSDGFFTAITLVLALLSEIQIACRFEDGLDARLKYLWGIVAAYWGDADALYKRRYAELL